MADINLTAEQVAALILSIGDKSKLKTQSKQTLVDAINNLIDSNLAPAAVLYTPMNISDESKAQARKNIGAVSEEELEAKQTFLPVAKGYSENGVAYTATDSGSGAVLPEVAAADSSEQISAVGKGRQIVFVPYMQNTTDAATLQINGGEFIPIRMRATKNQGSDESSPDATLPVPVGALMRGVPYTMTFCGKYWLVDSLIDLHTDAATKDDVEKYVDERIYEEQQTIDFRIALNDGSIGWHSNTGNKIAICYPEDDSFSDSLLKITRNAASETWNISCKNAPDRLLQVNSSSAYAAFYASAQVASMRLYDEQGEEITTDEMLQNAIYDSIFILAEKTNSEWYLLHPETTDDANPTRIVCTKIAKNDVFLGTVITTAQSIIDAVIDTSSNETYCFTFSAYSGEPVYKEKFAAVESVAVKASGNGGIMGDSCIANGENSLAIGEGTQTNVPGGYAGGRYNTSTGKLWVLGNGSESNKADAAWVDLGGNFKASGYIEDGSGNRLGDIADRVDEMWYGTSAVYKINKYPVAFSAGAATITVENPVNDIGVYAVRIGTLEYTANFVVVRETWSKVFNASEGSSTITVGFNGTELTISGADVEDGNYSVRFVFYNKTYIPAEYSRSPLYITGRIGGGKFLPDVDYTPEEIYLAFMSGRYVALYFYNVIVPLVELYQNEAVFRLMYAENMFSFDDGCLNYKITRNADGWIVNYLQEV